MKKILALLLSVSMIVSMAAISASAETDDSKPQAAASVRMSAEPTERSTNFNEGWQFALGENTGAEKIDYDDSSWRTLDLPHDWSIEFDFDYSSPATSECGYLDGGTGWYRKTFVLPESMAGKQISIDFGGIYMDSTVYVNGAYVGNYPYGYMPFSYDITDKVVCDGKTENVIAVKVVNQLQSSRWYSGSGIYRDVHLTVTDKVHVDRYGTYITTPNIETEYQNGTGTAHVVTDIVNDTADTATVSVRSTVVDMDGNAVNEPATTEAMEIAAGKTSSFTQDLTVSSPKLWSVDSPNLYQVKTEVLVGEDVVDTYFSRFGFRWIKFTTDNGFYLNGEWIKLNGVCMHHDQGALGSVANYTAIERQMQIMKDMGVNAIRVTHNPADDKLLEICDKMGLMVIEEAFDTWTGKKTYDYGRFFNQKATHPDAGANMTWAEFDLKQMIKRGRNFPSIIMWSLGNEITNTTSQSGLATAQNLQKWAKEMDDTRYTTIGEDKLRSNMDDTSNNLQQGSYIQQVFDTIDTMGLNYSEHRYDAFHEAYPNYLIYGSEIASATSSRGEYAHPDTIQKGDSGSHPEYQQSSYDTDCVPWGRTAHESIVYHQDRKFIAGEFVWTGFDYIGEPTPWNQSTTTPPKSSYFGIVDTAGFAKDSYYLYQSQWTSVEDNPMVHILPHWNWEDEAKRAKVTGSDGKIPVRVYTNARSVELYFKEAGSTEEGYGTLVGEKQTFEVVQPYLNDEDATDNKDYEYQRTADGDLWLEWRMDYKPGTLTAVAYDKNGEQVAVETITTASSPASVKLTAEDKVIAADGTELSYIQVDVVDENGNFVPTADNNITFTISGNGKIVGVDNGNAASHERYKDTNGTWQRQAFNGKALVIVQSTKDAGSFTINATSSGLNGDSTTVYTTAEGVKPTDILGYNVKNITAIVGEEIVLPAQVEAVYADGVTTKMMDVTWDEIPEISETGITVVKGTVTETGAEITIEITAIGAIGVLNSTIATAVGVIPEMPKTVQVIFSDGSTKSANVTWDKEITAEDVAQTGTIEINGKVEGYEGLTAKLTLRVSDQFVFDTNVARGVNVEYSYQQGTDLASKTVDGSYDLSSRWTTWTSSGFGNSNPSHYLIFNFNESKYIGAAGIYFFTDGATRLPQKAIIYYKDTDGNWVPVENQSISEIADFKASAINRFEFTPVNTTALKLELYPQKSGNNNYPVGVIEFEAYAAGTQVDVGTTAKLTSLSVNGQALEGFNPDTYSYTIPVAYPYDIPEITAEAGDNANVFVVPAMSIDRNTIVRVVSEDGKTENNYTIAFEKEPIKLTGLTLTVDPTTAPENATLKYEIKAVYEDGSQADGNTVNATINQVSAEGGEISINNADKEIYAVKKGTVTLEAQCEYQGSTFKSEPVTITITDSEIEVVVESYEPVNVTTKLNQAPALPEYVVANVKDSFPRNVKVTWDEIDPSLYADYGTFKVQGTVEGQTLRPEAVVTVKDITTFDTLTLATQKGVVPALPGTVNAYYSDGTSVKANVTWNSYTSEDFNVEDNTIVTVEGKATVNESEYTVTAKVRVTETDLTQSANYYQTRNGYELPFAVASFTNDEAGSTDRVEKLNDGSISFATSDNEGKNIWCNWQRTARSGDWVGVIMAHEGDVKENYVDTMKVGFFTEGDSGATQLPESYKIEYYTGPLDFELPSKSANGVNNPRGHIANIADHPFNDDANWTEVTYVGGKPEAKSGEMTTITFEPVETCIVRVNMKCRTNKSIGVTEIELYGKEVVEKSTYEITNVKVGGADFAEFDPSVTEYNISVSGKAPEVTFEVTNNASVTVVPATSVPGKTVVKVVAEDGSVASEKTYTFNFTSDGGQEYEIGDVNCDHRIDINDATMIQNYVSRRYEQTAGFHKEYADVSKDGKITVIDATLIQIELIKG